MAGVHHRPPKAILTPKKPPASGMREPPQSPRRLVPTVVRFGWCMICLPPFSLRRARLQTGEINRHIVILSVGGQVIWVGFVAFHVESGRLAVTRRVPAVSHRWWPYHTSWDTRLPCALYLGASE